MKKMLVLVALVMASFTFAGKIAWSIDTTDSTFLDNWSGKNYYSYYVVGPSVSDFMNSWTTAYEASGTVYVGKGTWDGTSNPMEVNKVVQYSGGNLIVILWDETANKGIYSWANSVYYLDDEYAIPSFDKIGYFDENGYDNTSAPGGEGGSWTKVGDTPMPEPGMLALLALGVAGLALRRKVA